MRDSCRARTALGDLCLNPEHRDGLCWIHLAHLLTHGQESPPLQPRSHPCSAWTAAGQRCQMRASLHATGPEGGPRYLCHVHYYPTRARELAAEAREQYHQQAQLRKVQ